MRTGIVALLGLCLCVAVEARATAPEMPRLRVTGVAQGLPASALTGLARDRDGFVWIATTDGLTRHDGVEFKVWQHDPAMPDSLPGNSLQALHVDHEDRVWVAAQDGGVGVMDASRSGFRRVEAPVPGEIVMADVWDFASRPGEIWMGSGSAGVIGVQAGRPAVHLQHVPSDPASLPSDTVTGLDFDADGVLWIGTSRGIASYDGHRVQRVTLPGVDAPVFVSAIVAMGDEVWVGTGAGLYIRTHGGRWETRGFSPMFARPNPIFSMAPDPQGGYWLGSRRGLWRLATPHGIPVPVPAGRDGTRPYSTRAVIAQPDGAVWASAGEGLGYLRSDWRQVAELMHGEGRIEGHGYTAVSPSRDGGIWLGSEAGVIEHLDAQLQLSRLDGALAERLKNVRILAIAETPQGTLWVSHAYGLLRYTRDGRIEEVRGEPGTAAASGVGYGWLLVDTHGDLWATGSEGGGIELRDGESGTLHWRLTEEPELEHGAWTGSAMSDGTVWMPGKRGFGWLSSATPHFHPVARDEVYYAVAVANDDTVWASRPGALERWRRVEGHWTRDEAATVDGLPVTMAMGLAVDGRGRPWLSTRRGLYRWDPGTRQLRHFGSQHGLVSHEMLHRALAISATGQLAAGTIADSIVLIDTARDDVAVADKVPALHLTAVEIRRDSVWRPAAITGDTIVLTPEDRELRVASRLLAFDDPASNLYWSWMEGLDSAWTEQDGGDRVFSGLTPGRHTLRLRARDAHGRISETRTLVVHVQPPWWRTWWALTGYALAAAALLAWAALAYRQRIRRRTAWQIAEHERALAEQASLAKSRFLATLGHEVRTPMTGVLGMSELLLDTELDPRQRDYTLAIRRAGDHLMRLVNDALDLARIEAGKLQLDPQPFDLQALVQDIVALCAPMAQQKGVRFDVHVDDGTPGWVLGDVLRVRQVLLNLIGNALKFTDAGHVALDVEPGEAGVVFSVRDTGPGLTPDQVLRLFRRFEQADGARTAARYGGSGLGLAISQELSTAMGGHIDVDSVPGEGTRFVVTLPLARIASPPGRTSAPGPQRITAVVGLEVLLVEDDTTVAEVIGGLLKAQGHHVVHVGHGLAALTEVSARGFDIALLDLDLPGVDGLVLAGLLRAQGFDRPLIAVTARADPDAEPAARAAGFDGFLRKPLTGEMLADAIADSWRPADLGAGLEGHD